MKRNQYYRPANRNHMRKHPNILAPLALFLAACAMLYGVSSGFGF